MTTHTRYNELVKDDYKVDDAGYQWVLDNLNHDAVIPYYEIPGNETVSGHAEIFEPDLDDE